MTSDPPPRHPSALPEFPTLEPVAPDLWVARRALPLPVGDVGTRMTVVRRAEGLWLHSPVALDADTRGALDALGPARWVVAPSRVHHFYVGDYAKAYPESLLCAAPGLSRKRPDLRFHCELSDADATRWEPELVQHLFGGAPSMSELVFLHVPTRTLILTDLAFNVTRTGRNRARAFHFLVGARGRFGPHRIVRLAIRDRAAARRSIEHILAWDFDRVIVGHGEVLERGGHDAFARAFGRL